MTSPPHDAPRPGPGPGPLVWIGWIGASALLLELYLIRVFDAIVGPTAAYGLVGLALFGISLAGVATVVRPGLVRPRPVRIAFALAAAPILLGIVLRFVPFSVARIPSDPVGQALSFCILGIVLTAPFFLSALAVVQLLASGPVRRIYAADLAGSALGPWILPWLLPVAGPAGVLLALAGGQLIGAAYWLRRKAGIALPIAAAILGTAALLLGVSGRVATWDIPNHAEKRGAEETRLRADAEFRYWDPVSKIEVVDLTEIDPENGEVVPGTGRRLISYDGGAQSSHIYAFDGDLPRLRSELGERIPDHFWQRGVLAAHWFHRDSGARVFVAGCAGGQEVTAALLFGASEIVAVDLVGTVVALGRERYADYNGGIFLDPRVHYYQAEARTELARSREPFDIIQIFSYHNSSRVAAGSLALKAFYLQTAETYRLCIERLAPDGILQIHQAVYPRVVTTLALAWRELGRENLEEHVLVYGRDGVEDHYTILMKNSAWTTDEIANVDELLLADFPSEGRHYERLEDPSRRGESFLPDAFYRAPLPDSLRQRAAFRVEPVTDDNPFSLYLRKGWGRIEPDPTRFATESEAVLLNQVIPERIPIPRDKAHLLLLGVAGLLLSILAFVTTWFVSRRGGTPVMTRGLYFYLVGLAFIGVEWVLVQFAMRLIALPIPAFGAAFGVVLVGAALGSWKSGGIRARIVFPALVVLGGSLLLFFPHVYPGLWDDPLGIRILVFVGAALPLTFFMGFPFPEGLASLGTPRDVASAWALNGAASVTGSVLAAALFASIGVGATGGLALLAYALAGIVYRRI